MSSSLARAGDKVNFLLLKLELLERDGSSDDEFNSLRREAMQAKQDLIIQRQACGFRFKTEEIVDRAYPVPAPKGFSRAESVLERQKKWKHSMAAMTSGYPLRLWRK